MQISTFRIDVIEAFSKLHDLLLELGTAICKHDQHLPGWFQNPKLMPNADNCRNQATRFLQQLEFLDEQHPKEILLGPGIFACSKYTLDLINKVNQAKLNFKKTVIKLKSAKIKLNEPRLLDEFRDATKSRNTNVATTLNKAGLVRLHLKQCYRQIPTLDSKPSQISWTWANTKAVTKIYASAARELLLKKELDYGISKQLEKLDSLGEQHLAIVQSSAPHLRVNVVYRGKRDKRFMLKGSVPIFYLGDALPEIRPPKDNKITVHKIRSDTKLEKQPFLPAINAYRYY